MSSSIDLLTRYTMALSAALHYKDSHTRAHSSRVVALCDMLGKAAKLSEQALGDLKLGATLHDIGKIGIPDAVLLKPGALNSEEWQIMQSHSNIGADIVRQLDFDRASIVADIVESHHLRYDGLGYPFRHQGTDILLAARIVLIADCYDAMTETRSYHPAFNHEQALQQMRLESGRKSDPALLELFFETLSQPENMALRGVSAS
jgi:putative two-component system response regulator